MSKRIHIHWIALALALAWLVDLFLGKHSAYLCDPGTAVFLAISGAQALAPYTKGWSMGLVGHLMYQKQKKPPNVDRGKQDDIRLSFPGYGESIPKGWGKFRCAPIWIWDTPIVHRTVTTPGQSGGKGQPKPPTPDTVDHIYTKSLAGVFHDGQIYKGVSRIWFDTDLVYHADLSDNLDALSSTKYEAEFAILAGGASVTTQAECSNGRKVTGLGSGGTATFHVDVDSTGNYVCAVHYTSTVDRTFKVSINGGASTDLVCTASGAASIVAIQTITLALTSGDNTIAFANSGAACPDLDYIDLIPSLSFTDGQDVRSFSGLVDSNKVAPTDQDQAWASANEAPVFTDPSGSGGVTDGAFVSATLSKYGNPQIRIYLGSETQDPDPAIIADKGSGNASAYRGYAYLVIEGLQLQNGRIPNVTLEVVQGVREVPTIAKEIYELCNEDSANLSLSALNGLLLGDSTGFDAGTYSAITWSGTSNAIGGAGGAISKTSGTDNTWNAYGTNGSTVASGNDGAIRFTAAAGTFMIGFSTTATPGSSLPHPYDQVIFGVVLNLNANPSQEAKNSIQMSLGGSNNSNDVGTWAVGDKFQVEIRNGRFSAYQNGLLLTGFAPSVPSYPLYPVFVGYHTGGGVSAASYAAGTNIGSTPTVANAGALVLASRRTGAELIGELMTRFQFDMPEVDGVVKAVLRNGTSEVTIPYSELRAHYDGEEMPAFDAVITDIDPLLLPRSVEVNYLDPQLDYHNNTQSAMRLTGSQFDPQSVSLAMVDSADNMKKLAEILLYKPDMEGRSLKIQTGPKYMRLHQGTVVTLTLPNATHIARVTEAHLGLPAGVCEFDLVRQQASIYSPTAVGSVGTGSEPPIVPIPGFTKGVIIDGPIVRAEDGGDGTQPVVYVAMCGRGSGSFPGAFLFKEFPYNSDNYVLVTSTDKQSGIGVGGFGNLSVNKSPSAGKPGTGSVDGEITYAAGGTYATAHDAATGTNLDGSGTSAMYAQNSKSGGAFYVARALIHFDTSSIPDNATIVSATISLYANLKAVNDSDSISIVDSLIVSNTDYALADFDLFGTTKLATDIAISAITTSAFNTFTLNASGLAAINKSGVSKFGIRTAKDVANTAPTVGDNYVQFAQADSANDPVLTVVYTVPALETVSDPSVWDRVNSLVINFYSNTELTSVEEQELLNNPELNLLAVINPSTNEVEYIQFKDATVGVATAPYITNYTVSTLLRGRIGTDSNVGVHTSADDVVVMDSTVKPRRIDLSDLNR